MKTFENILGVLLAGLMVLGWVLLVIFFAVAPTALLIVFVVWLLQHIGVIGGISVLSFMGL